MGLLERRIERGLSIEAVALRTKIGVDRLKEIEESRKMTTEEKEKLRKFFDNGKGPVKIEEDNTLHQEDKKAKRNYDHLYEQAKTLIEQGKSMNQTAFELSIPYWTVNGWFRKKKVEKAKAKVARKWPILQTTECFNKLVEDGLEKMMDKKYLVADVKEMPAEENVYSKVVRLEKEILSLKIKLAEAAMRLGVI